MDQFINIDIGIITANNPQLYSSADGDRDLIDDLRAYPIVDRDGYEVPIFNDEGIRVARRSLAFAEDNDPHAVLLHLSRIYRLFNSTHGDDDLNALPSEDDEDDYDHVQERRNLRRTHTTVYPQAFIKNVGHVQSDTVPKALIRPLRELNDSIHIRSLQDDDDESQADYNASSENGKAITYSAFQAYNVSMHHLRYRASAHDAQGAQVTAALSTLFAGVADQASSNRLVLDHFYLTGIFF